MTNINETVISEINRYSASSSNEEVHPAEIIINDVLDGLFWSKSGFYDGSSSSCKTISPKPKKHVHDNVTHEDDVDNRLKYWKTFLDDKKRIEKMIMKKTGKKKDEILMNFIIEHRRIELVKRIMDYAERLRPEKLKKRREEPVKLRNLDPCAQSVYETLPKTEKSGIPQFSIIDVPKSICKEQSLEDCKIRDLSWLKSEYLANRLFCKAEDIRRIISYFPEIENIYIDGLNLSSYEKEKMVIIPSDMFSTDTAVSFELNVMEEDIDETEENHEHVIKVNEFNLNAAKLNSKNIDIDVICESYHCEKVKTIMLTLQNCGWKTIDFYWNYEKENNLKYVPAFYFNKNSFRLIPGQRINIKLLFCTKKPGIYTEKWFLLSEPSFFHPNNCLVINLMGHCKEEEVDIQKFKEIYNNLSNRAAKNMTVNLLNIVTIQAIPEPPPKAPYIRYFTEKEIFTNLYPDINYSESGMEDLKALYRQANITTKCKCCPEWDCNIEGLKSQILSIDDRDQRRKLYFQFINVIKKMKRTPIEPKLIYEDQRFLLVKSVIIATMDKIDVIAENLRSQMTESSFPLEFDEVLVLNRQTKPSEFIFKTSQSINEEKIIDNEMVHQIENEMEGSEEDTEDPYAVVKSEFVRKKLKQVFVDSLYMQIFAHLGNAAEEIAGVIEGAKNLY